MDQRKKPAIAMIAGFDFNNCAAIA